MKAFSGEPALQAGKPALRSVPPEKAAVVSRNKLPRRQVAFFYAAEWSGFTPPLTCRAVWMRWMDMAALSGALELPGYDAKRRQYQACMWLPTKWDWVDPMKDASAEILQIEAGLKSRTQALSERGYDAEQVEREIAAERQRELELGLDFRRPGSPAQAPGQGNARNADDEGEADDADQENSKRRSESEEDQ